MATIDSTGLTRIDDGPVATVYSGQHAGVVVALKVFPKRLDKRTLAAFNKEQAKLSTVRRVTSILPVHGVDELTTGEFAVRMERCTQSLAALVDRVGSLPPADVVVLGRVVAEALAAAHGAGVVHGGISPHNVLFRTTGEPVVADFGVTLRQAFARDPLYAIEFLPPETLRTGTLNEATDLYGLGAVLHYALSGRSPHPGRLGEQPGERVLRILGEPVPAINNPDIPVGLSTLVARLLAADPARRLGDAAAVADQLGAMLPNAPRRPATDDFDDFSAAHPATPTRHAPPPRPVTSFAADGDDFDDFAVPAYHAVPPRPAPRPTVSPRPVARPPHPPVPVAQPPAPSPVAPPVVSPSMERPPAAPSAAVPPVVLSPGVPPSAERPSDAGPPAAPPPAVAPFVAVPPVAVPPPVVSSVAGPSVAAPADAGSSVAAPSVAAPADAGSSVAGPPVAVPPVVVPSVAVPPPVVSPVAAPSVAASPVAGPPAAVPPVAPPPAVAPSVAVPSVVPPPVVSSVAESSVAATPVAGPSASAPSAVPPVVPPVEGSLDAAPPVAGPPAAASPVVPPSVVLRPVAGPSVAPPSAPGPEADEGADPHWLPETEPEEKPAAGTADQPHPPRQEPAGPADSGPAESPEHPPHDAPAPPELPLATLTPAEPPTAALPVPATVEFAAQARPPASAAVARPDFDIDDDFADATDPVRGRARARVLASPLAPPGQAPKKLVRYDVLAGAALLLALLALVPLLLLRGDPEEISSTPRVPAANGSAGGDVEIKLDEPVDLTDEVRLSWTAPDDLDFIVVVAAEGKETEYELAERNRSMTLTVDGDLKYCFRVQATDGNDTYESNVVSLRNATCKV
ncbi:protein kinase [Actinophytocola sp. NPDC049390]|uniref:protein kinase domain-containing protein n=1 Tax=Actinophytocola sp. NPDC049390 TaxID=3363894 RepID=UPI0037A92A6A